MNLKTFEAFQWWNSQIEDCSDLKSPPQIVSAKIATSIFYKILPSLMIFDEFNDNDQAYWGEIHRFLNCRFADIKITNPSIDFPQFIFQLYDIKEKINPSNLTECFQFLKSYQTAQPAFFLLRQYPIIINNPILYFDTIINFSKYDTSLWQTIIKEYRFFDNFFYLNKSYFNQFPKDTKIKDWSIILLCSSAFSKVLSASLEYHTHSFTHSMLYVKEITKYFDVVPDDVFISLLRDIMSIVKSSYQKISLREKLEPKVCDILHSLFSKESKYMKYFIKFLISYEPNIISKSSIVFILTQNEICSISDIEIFEMICDSTTAYDILVYMSKNLIQSKIFHRSCSSFILNILKKYDKNEAIIEYTINYIDGLFIFISLAEKIQKYKVRSLFICETLNFFMESKIYWLQKSIMEAASTVAQVGYFPCYFDMLFPISYTKDSSFGNLLTTTMSKMKKIKLKFFPFTATKEEYVLFNINTLKNKKVNKKIDDCVNALKLLKTKTNSQIIIHSIGNELRDLMVLQTKYQHLFPTNFDSILLNLIKIKAKINMINLYQLIRIVLYFINESNFSRVIDFLKFGIETKTFNAIYELGIITKKYGIKYASFVSTAIDRLVESEENSTWAIQTYRRFIKNSKLQNEIVSVIVLSALSSDDEFVKIEGIKTLPYILYNDIDETAIYKNLKNELVSSNNKILFISSKSLTNTVYNNHSIAQNIFSRLIKKMERLKAFAISFPLFLKHFSISKVFQSFNDWSLFLLNLDDSYSLQHISAVSKIVIESFISIIGKKCPMNKILLQNMNNKVETDKQAVIILNSFALTHSSSKMIIENQQIFFNALNNDNNEVKILSIRCFEQFAKNNKSLGITFIQKIIESNKNNIAYYQAEALILKHISKFIDEKILNLIINDNSIINIIALSFLLPQQIPHEIDNYLEKILNTIKSNENNENDKINFDYLLFFLHKHQKIISEEVALEILRTLIDKIESLSEISLILIYQISVNYNDHEISKVLAEKSLELLIKIHDSKKIDFDNYDEFNREFLYNINTNNYNDDFSSLLLEKNRENISEVLFKQIISSFKQLISNTQINDQIPIIHSLFDSIIPTPDNAANKNYPILVNLSLIEKITCNEFKLQLPPNGFSVLLVLQRNRNTVDKITSCISKWIKVFPDSLDICFDSFIYNDPMMFSFFIKHHSANLNEYEVEAFYVQLKIHFDSNPLIVMKAIPEFVKNKFITKEMKTSIFNTLQELLSYDFLVRPETIRDFYEAIQYFCKNINFPEIIMSLLHFPLNSSIATYFGIKLMEKIQDKILFYPILDDIIDKNDILNKDSIPNAMNNEILFEALKIRNTIENIPLILLLYQQTNDKRVANLIKKAFELNPEISHWTNYCKMIIIDKKLPTNLIQNDTFSEEEEKIEKDDHIQIKPDNLLIKIMLSILKKLIPKIKEAYPFQIDYLETIFNIAVKILSNNKHQKKAASILNEIIISFGEIDCDNFISNHFCSIIKTIEISSNDISSFLNTNKLIFTLINYFEKNGNQKLILDLVNNVTSNLDLLKDENNIAFYLKTSSFLINHSDNFEIPSDFEKKATDFIKFVFDKKYFLRDLKDQLTSFIEILIKNYPKIIPIRILRILIIEEIYHKCSDYLLLAFSVITDFINAENSESQTKTDSSKSKVQVQTGNNEIIDTPSNLDNSDKINIEPTSASNEPKENFTELNNSNESEENSKDINNSNESKENNNDLNNANESKENNNDLNNANESNKNDNDLNNANESNKNDNDLNNANESKENNNDNMLINNESIISLSNSNESNESMQNNGSSENTKNNKDKNIKISSSSNELTVDEVTLVISKVEFSEFNRGIGYQRFHTSISHIIPNSIGNKWKNILRILLTSSIASPYTINYECISYILRNSYFKTVGDYIPAIFRAISLSKRIENDNEKVIDLISLIICRQPPQIIESLLAELISVRPYDQSFISEVMPIVFHALSGFSVNNSIIIDFLKQNFFDFSIPLIENLLQNKKTGKQGVLFVIHFLESISNDFKNELICKRDDFNQLVNNTMNLFEMFLKKASSVIKKKDFKKIQADVLNIALDLLPKIDESTKPIVCQLIKCISKEVLSKVSPKNKDEEAILKDALESC